MQQPLALFRKNLCLFLYSFLSILPFNTFEYIQDEVRHTVRVQQVSHFRLIDSLLASSSLKALRKQQSSFTNGILCKYLNNCVSMVILKGKRPSSSNTFELLTTYVISNSYYLFAESVMKFLCLAQVILVFGVPHQLSQA